MRAGQQLTWMIAIAAESKLKPEPLIARLPLQMRRFG